MQDANAKTILAEVRRHLNGVVAQSLREGGIEYPYSLGVPIATLREVAKGYAKSMPVARELIGRKLREAVLMASLIADTEQFAEDDYTLWQSSFLNTEAVEAASFYCLSLAPNPWGHIRIWLADGNAIHRHAGLMTLIHALRKGREIPESEEGAYCFDTLVATPGYGNALYALLDALHSRNAKLFAAVETAIELQGSEMARQLLAAFQMGGVS